MEAECNHQNVAFNKNKTLDNVQKPITLLIYYHRHKTFYLAYENYRYNRSRVKLKSFLNKVCSIICSWKHFDRSVVLPEMNRIQYNLEYKPDSDPWINVLFDKLIVA